MAGHLMQQGRIDVIVVGADRIAANGDTANKIGTYTLAALAERHRIPFYVAAPLSTIDTVIADGSAIPIEERDAAEVTGFRGVRWAPEGISVSNPAFDVTPADLITGLITEKGVISRPDTRKIRDLFES
jgi:methylthioribose-1-phosphate isomerase